MSENRWGGILQSIDSKGVAEELRKSLVKRLSKLDMDDSLKLLHAVRDELEREILVGRRIPEEIESIIKSLPGARVADELVSSMESFLRLAAELYNTRPSVSSTLSLASSFYDGLVTAAFNHAMSILESEGWLRPPFLHTLMVTGELGRRESVTGERSGFFFIYRESSDSDKEYMKELSMRFMAVLSICFPSLGRSLNSPLFFWYGSDRKWLETAAELMDAESFDIERGGSLREFAQIVEILADMRVVSGDAGFGEAVVESGRNILSGNLNREPFWYLAKEISSMPVALGLFGRLKSVKRGKNRGLLDLKGMAIDPLAAATRVLALVSGEKSISFNGRIKLMLAEGEISVALADRLLVAYQDLMRERIRLELFSAGERGGLFLNPDGLDEEAKERFKSALEDITTIQRVVHQKIVEGDGR